MSTRRFLTTLTLGAALAALSPAAAQDAEIARQEKKIAEHKVFYSSTAATRLYFAGEDAPAYYAKHRRALWSAIVLYKLQDEYVTHVARIDRTELLTRVVQGRRGRNG